MNAWAFADDQLGPALDAWLRNNPGRVASPALFAEALLAFLNSPEAAKLRIVEGSRLVMGPPPIVGARVFIDAIGTDGAKATTENREP